MTDLPPREPGFSNTNLQNPPTAAERACRQLLALMQQDADAWRVIGLGTEAFRSLCEAEAEYTGRDIRAVLEDRQRCFDPKPSRVEQLEQRLGEREAECQAWRQEAFCSRRVPSEALTPRASL